MRGGRPWDPALRSTAAAGKRGERERRPRGSDSPTHLELWWSVEGGRQWRAEVAGYGRGGGAADLGRGQAVVRAVVVEESCAQGLFIGGERRWSTVEAGRRARRPLMVLGLVGASRSGGAIRGGGADNGTARAEAERRAGHPGRVVRVGAQAHARAPRGEVLCSALCLSVRASHGGSSARGTWHGEGARGVEQHRYWSMLLPRPALMESLRVVVPHLARKQLNFV